MVRVATLSATAHDTIGGFATTLSSRFGAVRRRHLTDYVVSPRTSPRRPAERPAADQVQLELKHVLAAVHDEAIAVGLQPLAQRELTRDEDEVADEQLVFDLERVHRRNAFFRDDENMGRAHRVKIANGDASIVFEDDVRRDLLSQD